MSELIDISAPLTAKIPLWPSAASPRFETVSSVERNDDATVSTMFLDLHTGTHVDAPSHVLAPATTMSEFPLEVGVGEAEVLDCGSARTIDAELLGERAGGLDCPRVLLKTINSERENAYGSPFDDSFAALDLSGARWLAERGVRLVGIDYLSVQLFGDPMDTHVALLGQGTYLLEGLDLSSVAPGRYELLCLPLSIPTREAAPARAVLRRLDEDG